MIERMQLQEMVARTLRYCRSGATPAAASDIEPEIKEFLATWQAVVYDQHDWPGSRIDEVIQLQPGVRDYRPTTVALNRVRRAWWMTAGGTTAELCRGIDVEQYAARDSFNDERDDPPMRWDVRDLAGAPALEIWPVPLTNLYRVYLRATAPVPELVDDDDVSVVDGIALAMLAASSVLMAISPQRSEYYANLGERRILQVSANTGQGRPPFRYGGGRSDRWAGVPETFFVRRR